MLVLTYKVRAAMLALVLALAAGTAAGQTKGKLTREYDLKAAFLFNFAQFVEWPPAAFTNDSAPIIIGVLGNDPFGKTLDEIVANESVRGHPIVVQRCRTLGEAAKCHILFVSSSETAHLDNIFEFLDGKNILTVGDVDAFSKRGGIISFVVIQNKLRLRINTAVAKTAGLTISSQLLRQAEIVDAKQGPS